MTAIEQLPAPTEGTRWESTARPGRTYKVIGYRDAWPAPSGRMLGPDVQCLREHDQTVVWRPLRTFAPVTGDLVEIS